MQKIKIGIIGGAGYTGGELLRVLLNHERADVVFVQSRSKAGQLVSKVHTDLLGFTQLKFSDLESIAAVQSDLQAVFIALPHGESQKFLEQHHFADSVRVIDLSHDFRMKNTAHLKTGDGTRHFIYGLPEVNREQIQKANSIANPGCFATAIELALLPLAQAKKVKSVAVTGITGSTGAGVKLAHTSHFSFRANNIQAYKTLGHQHVGEIEETLQALQGNPEPKVSFMPWRGDFTRGIFVTALIDLGEASTLSKKEMYALYEKFYASHPFVAVSEDEIDLKSVVNTNRAAIEIHQSGSQFAIHVAIDNLLKGASGQAVQNFNLMFGLPETMGLLLKGTAF